MQDKSLFLSCILLFKSITMKLTIKLFSLLVFFSISNFFIAQGEFSYGESKDLNGFFNKVLSVPSGESYVITYDLMSSSNLHIAVSNGKEIVKTKDFLFKNGKENYFLEGIAQLEDKLVFCLTKNVDKGTMIYLKSIDLNLNDDTLVKVGKIEIKSTMLNNVLIDLISSKDNSNIAVLWNSNNSLKKSINNGFVIYEDNFSEVSRKDENYSIDPDFFTISDYHLTSKGELAYIITEFDKSYKKEQIKKTINAPYRPRKIINNYYCDYSHSYTDKIEIGVPDMSIDNIKISSSKKGEIYIVGGYSKGSGYSLKGVFIYTINQDDFKITKRLVNSFTVEMIIANLSETEKEKVLSKYQKNGYIPDMFDFDLCEVIVSENGTVYGVFEQYEENGYYVPNPNYQNEMRMARMRYENRDGGSTMIVVNNPQTQNTSFTYGDIIAFGIDTDGNFLFVNRINKNFQTAGINHSASFKSFLDNEKFYILFSDNIENYDQKNQFNKEEKYKRIFLTGWGIAVAEVDLNNNSFKRFLIENKSSKESKLLYAPRYSYIDEGGNLHLPCIYSFLGKTTINFGELKF